MTQAIRSLSRLLGLGLALTLLCLGAPASS